MEVLSNPELVEQDLPAIPFLIRPIIPIGGIVLMYGKRGVGKTQLGLTIAHDVIAGSKFGNHYQAYAGRVAYLQVDTPILIQKARVNLLKDKLGLNPPNLLWLLNDQPINIFNELDEDAQWIRDIEAFTPDLLIVDTLRKVHRLDEDSSETPSLVYGAFKSIAGPQAAVMFIHHEKKSSEFTRQDEMFRGSGDWMDGADTAINLIKEYKRKGLRLEFPKTRTCDDQPPLHLQRDEDTLLLSASDPKEALMMDMMMKGMPKRQIIDLVTDRHKWGEQAWSTATAYRRLDGYHGAE